MTELDRRIDEHIKHLVAAQTPEQRLATWVLIADWAGWASIAHKAWADRLEAALVQQCGSPEELRAALRWGGEKPPPWAARMIGQVRRRFIERIALRRPVSDALND